MKLIFDWDGQRNKGIILSSYLDLIREYFSIENKGSKYSRSPFNKRKYAITKTGRFNPGLFFEIIKYIKYNLPDLKVSQTPEFGRIINPASILQNVPIAQLKLTPFEHQQAALEAFKKYGRGLILIGTGGGKTLITALITKTMLSTSKDANALILVPNGQLMEQTCTDFIDYGIDENLISKWSGIAKVDKNAPIIIATMKILQSKKQDPSFLFNRSIVLVDEAHGLRLGNKNNKILAKFKTPFKIGLTATLPSNIEDQWNIKGHFGRTLVDVPSIELIGKGYLSDRVINILNLNYDKYLYPVINPNNPTEAYNKECDFLFNHPFRNKVISHLATQCKGNLLITVDRLEHGQTLYDLISEKAKHKQVYYITGEMKIKDRENIRKEMEYNSNFVCIAIAKIFSTGINIKNLRYIIFAQGSKAKITLIQTIGRGLRLHEYKDQLDFFDIADMQHYGQSHLEERLNFYKEEKAEYVFKDLFES
jgi:superfamily II DNA or RNA helicase